MIIFDSEDNNPFDFLSDTNDGMMKRLNLPLRWIRQMAQIRFWREADRAMLSTGIARGAVLNGPLFNHASLSSEHKAHAALVV